VPSTTASDPVPPAMPLVPVTSSTCNGAIAIGKSVVELILEPVQSVVIVRCPVNAVAAPALSVTVGDSSKLTAGSAAPSKSHLNIGLAVTLGEVQICALNVTISPLCPLVGNTSETVMGA